jgi:DNA polymerase III alpha subunit
VSEPLTELAIRCGIQLEERGLTQPRYRARLESELQVVLASGMAGYLLLVQEVTDHCRAMGIFFQARGSAASALICYILGITPVDPLKWGLLMERFLSKDRTKPPDVDLDIESSRREEVIAWLDDRFAAMQIGTWGTASMSGDHDGKGSLRVKYFSSRAKQGMEKVDWKDVDSETQHRLYRLSDRKVYSHYGVHAGGVLLTSTRQELEDLVPAMWVASSKKLVSQYDQHDVEKLGLVKLDVLGVKTMGVLRIALENMGRDPQEGLDFIPLNDAPTYRMVANGGTAGVFQLEGGTATRGVRELQPDRIKDLIAAMALFRPATMNSGATTAYIARKHGQQRVPERHDLITKHTKDTYGILLYQEQVMSVLRDLGLDADELTKFLKAVKASNGNVSDATGVIREMLTDIKHRCTQQGMTEADVTWLEQALEAYANYGFNAAHATVYGLTAYRCAWLAKNHPVEFHAALLAVAAGEDKEPMYVQAARHRGVRVRTACVQESGVTYAMAGNAIRRGLTSVSGVGVKVAEAIAAESPFTGLDDFAARVNPRLVTGIKDLKPVIDQVIAHDKDTTDALVGVIAKLYRSGALDSLLLMK